MFRVLGQPINLDIKDRSTYIPIGRLMGEFDAENPITSFTKIRAIGLGATRPVENFKSIATGYSSYSPFKQQLVKYWNYEKFWRTALDIQDFCRSDKRVELIRQDILARFTKSDQEESINFFDYDSMHSLHTKSHQKVPERLATKLNLIADTVCCLHCNFIVKHPRQFDNQGSYSDLYYNQIPKILNKLTNKFTIKSFEKTKYISKAHHTSCMGGFIAILQRK